MMKIYYYQFIEWSLRFKSLVKNTLSYFDKRISGSALNESENLANVFQATESIIQRLDQKKNQLNF